MHTYTVNGDAEAAWLHPGMDGGHEIPYTEGIQVRVWDDIRRADELGHKSWGDL